MDIPASRVESLTIAPSLHCLCNSASSYFSFSRHHCRLSLPPAWSDTFLFQVTPERDLLLTAVAASTSHRIFFFERPREELDLSRRRYFVNFIFFIFSPPLPLVVLRVSLVIGEIFFFSVQWWCWLSGGDVVVVCGGEVRLW
ncbi:hypothetical protein PIB30_002702 [Stylosanthes scabra]|uniref:Uncharacterized protein n=1 Tax=Stylosanthes scabra TaxID=79078 RepID=A0ABU6R239_9FABA|nr:hypothetical protein [Stylosanthes scabra]